MPQQDDEFTNFKSHNYYKSSQYTGIKEAEDTWSYTQSYLKVLLLVALGIVIGMCI